MTTSAFIGTNQGLTSRVLVIRARAPDRRSLRDRCFLASDRALYINGARLRWAASTACIPSDLTDMESRPTPWRQIADQCSGIRKRLRCRSVLVNT
jgi:hypothetical protein